MNFKHNNFVIIIAFIITLAVCCLLPDFSQGQDYVKKQSSSKRTKIAIIPWKINAEENLSYLKDAVNDMLASRIGVETSIEIIKETLVKSVISNKYSGDVVTDDIAKIIGKEVDADYVILGSITIMADSVSIDAKTLNVKTDEPPVFFASKSDGVGNLITLIDELAKDTKTTIINAEETRTSANSPSLSSLSYSGKFIAKEKTEEYPNLASKLEIEEEDKFIISEKTDLTKIWKSHQFETVMQSIDIADVDGDKKNEIVIMDVHSLFIYRLSGQNKNQKFELVKELKGDAFVKNLSLSIADMDNNGKPEIYITRIVNDRLDSYVVEYDENEYKTKASDLRWFIRVLNNPKTGHILIGQRYSDSQGYFGSVQKLEWKNGKLNEVRAMDIPKGLNVFNFEMADLDGNGEIDIVTLDERDYLHVYSKDKNGLWNELWKSTEFYGGSLNRMELGSTSNVTETNDFVDIKARIISSDYGLGKIIISKNNAGELGHYFKWNRSYSSGEIIDLLWEDNSLRENWKTRKIDGYLADFVVNDIDNDGQKELAILVVTDGGLGKSYIMAYKTNRNLSQ